MKHTMKPRIAPRDVVDVLIGLPLGILVAWIIFGGPAIIAGMVTQSFEVGFLAFCVVYAVSLLFLVRKITVDDNGIVFHRILGSPKILSWSDIVSIVEVSRKELVIKGWLWPLFPPRESTACLSAKHHFRVNWTDGFCYFPPGDIPAFEKLIKQRLEEEHNKPDPKI